MRDSDLLNLVGQVVLHDFAERLVVFLLLLNLGLLLVGLLNFETLFGDANKFVALKLLELGNGVLVDCNARQQLLQQILDQTHWHRP